MPIKPSQLKPMKNIDDKADFIRRKLQQKQ